MNIPTVKECFKLIHQTEMLDNIRRHSVMVGKVALFIAEGLAKKQCHLNHSLIYSAALLHDITKTRSLKTGEFHAETGGEFLLEEGYPEVGDIVRQHVLLDQYIFHGKPYEAEIVNYADKRVLHEDIESLEKRIDYIYQRYGTSQERKKRILWGGKQIILIEQKIFNILGIDPVHLSKYIHY